MTLFDWAYETQERIRSEGAAGARESLYELYIGGLRRAGQLYNYGDPIYEQPWDVLIVLDGTRVDLMKEVSDNYGYLSNPSTVTSNASSSAEWMQKNFVNHPEMASNITYVTGNPFSDKVLHSGLFNELDEVWKYAWNNEQGTILPDAITDRAIYHGRQTQVKRLVVHYMQPHYPFVHSDMDYQMNSTSFGTGNSTDVWDDLRHGVVSRETVWDAYRENLIYVLDHVGTLLNNINSDRVAITADHGNLLGEWGVYGHPEYAPIPRLKEVPWYTTSAVNSGEYKPTLKTKKITTEVSERLQDLGYQ